MQEMSVKELVRQFVNKEILLPEIQRGYVWTPEKARALIDSIYKGYPSGSILLWDADSHLETRDAAVATKEPETKRRSYLLLDGQQRLTALSAVMTGAAVETCKNKDVQKTRIEICFNMNHPNRPDDSDTVGEDLDDENKDDEHVVFKIKNQTISNNSDWIDVTQLLEKGPVPILSEKNIDSQNPNYTKYLDRLYLLHQKLSTYNYTVQTLDRDKSYAEVADIFVRINSQGTKLRKSDLALAQVTSRWKGSMAKFSALSEECLEKGYNLDEGFLLRCLISVATGQCRFKNISSMSIRTMQESWEKTKTSLRFVIDFLKNNAGVETTEILSAKFLIIPMVCIAVKRDYSFTPTLERTITRWFYAALMWGRYSRGATETILDEDLGLIRDDENPIEQMVEKIRMRSGRLEVKEEDLAVSYTKNPFFYMMYILARNAKAKDWRSGLVISTEAGEKLRYKQVFDPSTLKESTQKKHGAKTKRQIGLEIANIVFVDKLDRQKHPRPEEHLEDVVKARGEDALGAQCVPTDPALWQVQKYEDFLLHRRRTIATAINDLMKSLESKGRPRASDTEIIKGGESAQVEFKSSLSWDYKQQKKNTNLADATMRAVTAFLNTDGGTVYVGVADDGSILGLDADYGCMPKHKNWDGWSMSFANALDSIGKDFAAYVTHEKILVDGKAVAKITVKKIPIKIGGGAYMNPSGQSAFIVRNGTTNRTLNSRETAEYLAKRSGDSA